LTLTSRFEWPRNCEPHYVADSVVIVADSVFIESAQKSDDAIDRTTIHRNDDVSCSDGAVGQHANGLETGCRRSGTGVTATPPQRGQPWASTPG